VDSLDVILRLFFDLLVDPVLIEGPEFTGTGEKPEAAHLQALLLSLPDDLTSAASL